MFIQCEHCQTKYQIDEGKLPDRKAVVKCSKCAEDISLPAKNPENAPPYQLIECPDCSTQYAVPLDRFSKDAIKAHCGKCNHEFIAQKSGATSEIPAGEDFSHSGDGLLDQDDPLDNDLDHLDDLGDFDNLDGSHADDSIHEEDDQAYLDSVSLGAGDELETEAEMEEITDEDAAGLFLNQDAAEAAPEEKEEEKEWPDISDETEPEEADPFLEEAVDLSTQAPAEPKEKKEKKKKNPLLLVFLLLAIAGGGYYYQQQEKSTDLDQVEVHQETTGQAPSSQAKKAVPVGNRLTLKEPLRFQEIQTATGEKIILLKGKIKNLFQPDDIIRKIKLSGKIINQKGKVIARSTTYAGVLLLTSQISTSKAKDLTAHYNDPTLSEKTIFDRFNRQKTVNFQILFTRLPKDGEVFEAKIISYQHNGILKKVN